MNRNFYQAMVLGNGRTMAGQAMAQGRRRRMSIGDAQVMMTPMMCPTPMQVPCLPQMPVCPENQRRFSMSFNQAAVTAGSTVTISASPQKPFKGDRLIIPSTIGPSFTVLAVIVGTAPQNVATGETSAVIYSEVSTNSNVDFYPAFPGINISLQVKNISGGTLDFTATLFGDVINGPLGSQYGF